MGFEFPLVGLIIRRMPGVLHVIDASSPRGLLEQLSLLAGQGERIICAAPAPRCPPGLAGRLEIIGGCAGCAFLFGLKLRASLRREKVVHAWSAKSARAAISAVRRRGLAVLASVESCEPHSVRVLRPAACEGLLKLTFPTAAWRGLPAWAGVYEQAAFVLPPATADEDAQSRRMLTRRRLGVDDRTALLVAPAEATADSGHKYAVWAHAIVRQVRADVRLLVPGQSKLLAGVRDFSEAVGHAQETFFPADALDPADAIAAADVALFLHRRDQALWELAAAMRAGAAIVACDTPDFARLLRHGQSALLVAVASPRAAAAAVLRLLEDKALAAGLGAEARRQASEQFAPAAVRRTLDDIYAGLACRMRA